jgi:hypothetical protein
VPLRHQLHARHHAAVQPQRSLEHGVVCQLQLAERLRVVQLAASAHQAHQVRRAADGARLERAHALVRVGLHGHGAPGERAYEELHGSAGRYAGPPEKADETLRRQGKRRGPAHASASRRPSTHVQPLFHRACADAARMAVVAPRELALSTAAVRGTVAGVRRDDEVLRCVPQAGLAWCWRAVSNTSTVRDAAP